MIFHDYTLQANGAIRSHRVHDTEKLAPAAVDIFTQMIQGRGEFEEAVPVDWASHIRLRWTPAPGGALATFSAHGAMLTTSALITGEDAALDRYLLDGLGRMVAPLARAEGQEPMQIETTERPVIFSVPWPVEARFRDDLALVADMETCLAAAFFDGQ